MSHIHREHDIKPLSEFRAGVTSCIRQISETGRPLVITQEGKGIAVVLDAAEYEAMREKLELLDEMLVDESQQTMDEAIEYEARSEAIERKESKKSDK